MGQCISFSRHIVEAQEEVVNERGEMRCRKMKHKWWGINECGGEPVASWFSGGNTIDD